MREIFEYKVELSSLKLNKEELLSHTGSELLEETLGLLPLISAIEARGAFTVTDPDEADFIYGPRVKNAFRRAEKIVLFVATLGGGVRNAIEKKREDAFAYYMLDFLASKYADAVADYMSKRINEYAIRASMGASNRYSPGYCGWNVQEQKKLFAFFPAKQCGITLTGSCLMDPVKSVSGAVAIGKDVVFQEYGCKNCNIKNCLHKSIK